MTESKQGANGLIGILLKRASLINFTEWMGANKKLLGDLPDRKS
jgi:hypothetical protein